MNKTAYLFGASLLFLSACATTNSNQGRDEEIAELLSDPRVGEEVERICFQRNIDRFSETTDYSVVVRRSVSEASL